MNNIVFTCADNVLFTFSEELDVERIKKHLETIIEEPFKYFTILNAVNDIITKFEGTGKLKLSRMYVDAFRDTIYIFVEVSDYFSEDNKSRIYDYIRNDIDDVTDKLNAMIKLCK